MATPQDPWIDRPSSRLSLVLVATSLSVFAWTSNVEVDAHGFVQDVVLTPHGLLAWLGSLLVWALALGGLPAGGATHNLRFDSLAPLLRAIRSLDGAGIAVLGATLIGLWIRLVDFGRVPPEMTSDHIELLLDSLRVAEGHYPVFFPNNGGREAFQMYVVAFLGGVLGVGFDFGALKLATILEGVLTIPLAFWMTQEVFGRQSERSRQLGRWVGASMAGLLAVEFWPLMLSRQGLRVTLTPLLVTVVIGFTARALWRDRRIDYLAVGLFTGFGLYLYQANRVLPLVVVASLACTLFDGARTWRKRIKVTLQSLGVAILCFLPFAATSMMNDSIQRKTPFLALAWIATLALWLRSGSSETSLEPSCARGRLGGLLIALVMTFAVAVPIYHYSTLWPEHYWDRTQGRILGDPLPITYGAPSHFMAESGRRLWDQRNTLLDNGRRTLGMFHLAGDVAWINNANGTPALDPLVGFLMVVGGILWLARVSNRPGPAWPLVPLTLSIMLLPTALAIAQPMENPSFTRGSGAMPAAFLLASLPLGWVLCHLAGWSARHRRSSRLLPLTLLACVLLLPLRSSQQRFFGEYHRSYVENWPPYREIARPLREFFETEGPPGNAFVIAYPHWLDHRILGAAAGELGWPNGLTDASDLLEILAAEEDPKGPFSFDATQPLLVLYHPADSRTRTFLESRFPIGRTQERSVPSGLDGVLASARIFRLDPQSGD